MVSRAAFYRNYQDKYDLVERIFAEEHPPQIWVRFFEHIAAYERLYGALLGRKGSPWFVLKMRTVLVDLIKKYQRHPLWKTIADRPIYPDADEFVPTLVAAMLVEAIAWWLEQGRSYTPQELATRCALLASAIFKETSTWQ